jgi:hypothetical protein
VPQKAIEVARGIASHLVVFDGEILRKRKNYSNSGRVRGGLNGCLAGLVAMLQPFEYHKCLVGQVISITPAFTDRWIEKIAEHVIRVESTRVLRFQRARTLKFREAFQFVPG